MARPKKQKDVPAPSVERQEPAAEQSQLLMLPVASLRPSSLNPRKTVSDESLKDLCESIARYGILQPIIVRELEDILDEDNGEVIEGGTEIICGYRRWRASQMLGLETIPAQIRYLDDKAALDLMITENLQREDISPLEEAEAYAALIEHNGSVAELAARFGKSEKYIRGRLYLNDLTDDLKTCLTDGRLLLSAAIELGKMSPAAQDEFYDNYIEEPEKDKAIIPATLSDVRRYLEDESNDLDDEPFLEDGPDEKWNHEKPHCQLCGKNSSSQLSLFSELADAGQCLDKECLDDKRMAYAAHVVQFWLPNLLPAGRQPDEGDIVIYDDSQYYRDEFKAKISVIRSLVKSAQVIGSNYSRIWGKMDKCPVGAFRAISLSDLIQGRPYMLFFKVPPVKSQEPKERTHNDVYNSLTKLLEKRQQEIYDILLPMSQAALESYFATDDAQALHLPPFLETFVAYTVINDMSYGSYRGMGLSNTSLDAIDRYMDEGYRLSDVLHAALTDRINDGQSYLKPRLLELVMTGVAESATAEATEKIYDKYRPKIDKLIAELAEMGYDQYNRPLEPELEGEDKSDDNNE